MSLRFSLLCLALITLSGGLAQAHDVALDYTPPSMFDDSPAVPGHASHPDDYAEPEAGFPAQVIEGEKLYTLPVKNAGIQIESVVKDVPAISSYKIPPLPTGRPGRFAVSKAYAQSLLQASYGHAPAKPEALKIQSMDARDVLKSLE
jgi:hypothetical protein